MLMIQSLCHHRDVDQHLAPIPKRRLSMRHTHIIYFIGGGGGFFRFYSL